MPLHSPISLSGYEAQIDSIESSFEALVNQNKVCRLIYDEEITNPFLPAHIKADVFKYTFVKGLDADLTKTLLLIAIVGSFEKFIKVLVNDVLQTYMNNHASFTKTPDDFQKNYLASAGDTLSYLPQGSVRGVRVNFDSIRTSMRECLNDDTPYTLIGDAVTSQMGNPSKKTIDQIFGRSGLASPFDHQLAQKLVDEKWRDHHSTGPAVREAEGALDGFIDKRNEAVHGLSSLVLGDEEMKGCLQTFRVIGAGLFSSVDKKV